MFLILPNFIRHTWFGAEQDFSVWPFRSREISVRLRNLAEILHVRFQMQTYLNQRKVLFKKTTIMMQHPTVNQHQHRIFHFHQQANLIIIDIMIKL